MIDSLNSMYKTIADEAAIDNMLMLDPFRASLIVAIKRRVTQAFWPEGVAAPERRHFGAMDSRRMVRRVMEV